MAMLRFPELNLIIIIIYHQLITRKTVSPTLKYKTFATFLAGQAVLARYHQSSYILKDYIVLINLLGFMLGYD